MEINCPRCSAPCSTKSKERNEYKCPKCGATFRFIDPTKREIHAREEVVYTVQESNCLYCGGPVPIGEGYACTECKRKSFHKKCVEEIDEKYLCKECITNKGLKCDSCSKSHLYRCPVCGSQRCLTHSDIFNVKEANKDPCSLWCPSSSTYVCNDCIVQKRRFLFFKAFYCKKCGSKLISDLPLTSSSK